MMERVFDAVGLDPTSKNVKLHDTSASSDCYLDNDTVGKPRLKSLNYRSAVGCILYTYGHPSLCGVL